MRERPLDRPRVSAVYVVQTGTEAAAIAIEDTNMSPKRRGFRASCIMHGYIS